MTYSGRNSSPVRRVAPSTSLSARFQQLQRSRPQGRANTPQAGGNRPSAQGGRPRVVSNIRKPSAMRGVSRSNDARPVSRRGGNAQGGRRNRAFNAVSRMDIDTQGQGQQRGGNRGRGRRGDNPRNNRPGNAGQPSRGISNRRGGRGGRGGRQGGRPVPLSQEKLDMDLDNYMMSDTKTARSTLDQDLDSYMQTANL